MVGVPCTFESVQKFISKQENILCKPLKNNSDLREMIKEKGIIIKNEELDRILKRINKEFERKYRLIWFTRQGRFQLTQQVIQIEQGRNKDKIEKIDWIKNLLKLMENTIGDIHEFDSDTFDLIKELPDSNLINTNDVDIIEDYDNVRDNLIQNIQKLHVIEKSCNDIQELNKKVKKIIERETQIRNEDDNLQDRLNSELQRMKHLLNKVKN